MIKLASLIKEKKSDYEVYHKSYTSAINAARDYAEKNGYEINDDDAFTKIGMESKIKILGIIKIRPLTSVFNFLRSCSRVSSCLAKYLNVFNTINIS